MARNRRRAGFALPLKRTFRRRVLPRWVVRLATPFAVVALVIAAGKFGLIETPRGQQAGRPKETASANVQADWVDGDSGRLDGREFRLHGVDAPEGSPQHAKCAKELGLSGQARDAARSVTEGRAVRVSRSYGADTYGRKIVDLSAGGRDVADQLVASGKLKRWNFDGGDAKPDWCREQK